MHEYLEAQDDGLTMRSSGPWALKKLDYLQRYIDTFVTSMHSKPWCAMHYIDLFAGPGKCRVERTGEIYLGSPVIALQAPHPFTGYYFVDLEPENITTLRKRCSASPHFDRVQCLVGDSNQVVHQVVKRISEIDQAYMPGQWSSLNMAFLDPAGLDLRWETIKALARINRMDLVIHYPEMALNRSMPNVLESAQDSKVDLFFGGREWRKIYSEWKGRAELRYRLIDHYKENLCSLGYVEVLRGDEPAPLMRNVEKKAPLYRLVFASKHERGHDFWRKVTRRDVYGQRRLF